MANTENDSANKQSAENESHEETHVYEDEIDLRSYIEVVVKRRKLIIGIFLAAVVLAAIYSLMLPKVYQASSSIILMPSTVRMAVSPSRDFLDPQATKIGGYVEQKLAISIPTHEALLKSNTVLEMLLERLKAAGLPDDVELTVEQLSEDLKIYVAEETNVLQLIAKNTDPVWAKNIANFWAEEYEKYSMAIIEGEMEGSGNFVVEQFKLANENLTKAEKAIKDFDVSERLSLLSIELVQSETQLKSHYTKSYELDFAINEKKSKLDKTNADIAAMTKDGVWLGAFGIGEAGRPSFADDSLDADQKLLREKVLDTKVAFDQSVAKRNAFINSSKINLLRDDLARRKGEVVTGKTLLAKIEQLSESTAANLSSDVRLESWSGSSGPLSENLSDLTVWEILSLAQGYNFFETRGKSLASNLVQQEAELKVAEETLLKHEIGLKVLDDSVGRADANYGFYHGLLKKRQAENNSAESEITMLSSQRSYSRTLAGELEDKVNSLKVTINEKEMRLTGLNRQLTISKNAYTVMASKIEEARIAKAMELGEVKMVSMAFEPQNPVAPNKRKNVAIAGAVSLMLGVFMAFCLESWQKSQVQVS